MPLRSLIVAIGVGVSALGAAPSDRGYAANARSTVPAFLQLGKPLHARHLMRQQVLKAVDTVMPLQGHTYTMAFGSWIYLGVARKGMRPGQKIDVWEARINGVTTYSYCPLRPKSKTCQHQAWHHLAVLIDDRNGQVLQTVAY